MTVLLVLCIFRFRGSSYYEPHRSSVRSIKKSNGFDIKQTDSTILVVQTLLGSCPFMEKQIRLNVVYQILLANYDWLMAVLSFEMQSYALKIDWFNWRLDSQSNAD